MQIQHWGTKLSFHASLDENGKEISILLSNREVIIKTDKVITEFLPSIEGGVICCFFNGEDSPYFYDVSTGREISTEKLVKMEQRFFC